MAIEKRLKEEFAELSRIRKIVAKSKMTQKDADELADKVSFALAKRYEKAYKKKSQK